MAGREGRDSLKPENWKELAKVATGLRKLIEAQPSVVKAGRDGGAARPGNHILAFTVCRQHIKHVSWNWTVVRDFSKHARSEEEGVDAILNLLEHLQASTSWKERNLLAQDVECAIINLLTLLSCCNVIRERVVRKGGLELIVCSLGLLQDEFKINYDGSLPKSAKLGLQAVERYLYSPYLININGNHSMYSTS